MIGARGTDEHQSAGVYISLSPCYLGDHHRNPNDDTEIILLGDLVFPPVLLVNLIFKQISTLSSINTLSLS